MNAPMRWLLGFVGVFTVDAAAFATPLPPAQYLENWSGSITGCAFPGGGGGSGASPALPESIGMALNSGAGNCGAGASGSVTATVLTSGTSSPVDPVLARVDLSATGSRGAFARGTAQIFYQFQVVGGAVPPGVPIPIRIRYAGFAAASGLGANGSAGISVGFVSGTGVGAVLADGVTAISGLPSQSLAMTRDFAVTPGVVQTVALTANGTVSASVPGSVGALTVWIDPVVEVRDEPIPGTTTSFRDVASIVLAPGVVVPEPGPLALWVTAAIAAGARLRRRSRRADDLRSAADLSEP